MPENIEARETALPRRERTRRLSLLVVCILGIFLPILGVFPLASSHSGIPLAATAVCLSLTCLALLPFLWQRAFHPQSWLAPWAEGSPELDKWMKRQKLAFGLSAIFFFGSILFVRRWHPDQINWQQTVADPGYMFMMWATMIRSYIDARRPPKSSVYKHFLEGIQPIQSEHWGRQTE